jgi:hypothetical protein
MSRLSSFAPVSAEDLISKQHDPYGQSKAIAEAHLHQLQDRLHSLVTSAGKDAGVMSKFLFVRPCAISPHSTLVGVLNSTDAVVILLNLCKLLGTVPDPEAVRCVLTMLPVDVVAAAIVKLGRLCDNRRQELPQHCIEFNLSKAGPHLKDLLFALKQTYPSVKSVGIPSFRLAVERHPDETMSAAKSLVLSFGFAREDFPILPCCESTRSALGVSEEWPDTPMENWMSGEEKL